MAKAIMIQGTMSNSGKSFVTAGLCRVFKQDGYRVAPFKSQNMALNSYITREGLEIGRAQAMQAEASMIEPTHWMNPILLKPTSDMGSQVIVNGEVYGNMDAVEYYKNKDKLVPEIMKAFEHLSSENDIIVIEGAGSPAEINLADNDIVNMGMAKMANAPVILVADIDRGGVFASAYGTIKLLPQEEQDRFCGIAINKFRGDVDILKPGLSMLEELTGKPVLGVIPMEKIDIDDEDSLSDRLTRKSVTEGIDIAVIRLPKISNFTDFSVFELLNGVSIRYVSDKRELGNPDLIILPGSKNTMGDMEWLIESGLESAIKRAARTCRVIGICGGFQLLGKELHDPEGVEHGGDMRGLGLLDISTVFAGAKTRTRITGTIEEDQNLYGVSDRQVEGYEIHMGTTESLGEAIPMIRLEDGRTDAYVSKDGRVWGSYLHGIFDNEEFVMALVHDIMKEKGIDPDHNELSIARYKEIQYDKLADLIRRSLDMDKIYEILFGGSDAGEEEEKETIGCGGIPDDRSGRGLVHIYCGNGKGKTTCSVGLMMRAAGRGKRIIFHQFLKDNQSGERRILSSIPSIKVVPGVELTKFTFQMDARELDELRDKNDEMFLRLTEMAGEADMLVLDEAVYAIDKDLLSEDKVIDFLKNKPEKLEVVLTGRNPSEALVEAADYVSEICKRKHPFDQGISARVGIER